MVRNRQLAIGLVIVLAVIGLTITPGPIGASDHGVDCEYPLELTDATGETVELNEAPEEIVTTAPSAAQTLWQIGAEDKVTGVTMHAMSLDGASDRTNISANPFEIDVEVVVDLDPDLVIAPNVTPPNEIEALRAAGLTVYQAYVSTSINDIMEKTERIGALAGECEGADATLSSMSDRLDAIDAELEDIEERPLVFYASGGGFSPGADTFQHDALERAGLTNLAAEAGLTGWQPISEEVLIDEDPEWIIYPDSMTEEMIIDSAKETTAWEEGQVIAVDSNAFSQPAPDIVDVIETIHTEIHGEIEVETPTPTPAEDSTAIPGFGIAIALVALVGFALLSKRQ